MTVKVLFTRGEGCYIVQKDSIYYLVNIETNMKPLISEFAESFLKFGYFEKVTNISKEELSAIQTLLSNQEY